MAKFNDIRELAQQNARWVSNSPKDWMNYLDVVARLYRYSFKDTLLIHAQRPDATACAELEVWNKKMNRWVNRGAKGIALLDDASPRAKLRYVFDIADTHLVQGGKTPILWRIDYSEHQRMILDHLADTYALTQTDSMNAALMELAQQLTAENLEEAMDGLEYEVTDTFLEGLDEDNLRVRFRELMTNSIFYTLSRRCGQEPLEVLDDEDFIRIVDFNQLPVLTFLGNAVSEQCEAVLRDIGREMQKIYRKEVTEHLAKTADSLYNTSTDFSTLKREIETNITEGGKPYGTDLSPQGGLPVSNLTVQDKPMSIGKYGMLRRTYLRENKKNWYQSMLMSGRLNQHLAQIDEQAENRMEELIESLNEKYPAPNKETEQMAWVAHQNNLTAMAEEIVLKELVYN